MSVFFFFFLPAFMLSLSLCLSCLHVLKVNQTMIQLNTLINHKVDKQDL